MKKHLCITLIFYILTFQLVFGQEITVAAAANTRYAINEIVQKYKNLSGEKIHIVYASSGKLAAQIMHGAPYDVFISANFKYPQTIFTKGFALDQPKELIKGSLIFWTRNKEDLKHPEAILLETNIKTVAIANPKNAPYGIATLEYLNSLEFAGTHNNIPDKVYNKIIYLESISQVNQHISLNSIDAAFTSKSFIYTDMFPETGSWTEIDTTYYSPIKQFVVQLKNKRNTESKADKFIQFLHTNTAKEIFKKYGYF